MFDHENSCGTSIGNKNTWAVSMDVSNKDSDIQDRTQGRKIMLDKSVDHTKSQWGIVNEHTGGLVGKVPS